MTKDQIIAMAGEAGMNVKSSAIDGRPWIDDRAWCAGSKDVMAGSGYQRPELIDAMTRFASLVAAQAAAEEREECAKVSIYLGSTRIAAAIRERKRP